MSDIGVRHLVQADGSRWIVRILVFGAGVIGSVYAGKLVQARHDVTLLARGARLSDLRDTGLVLQEAETGHRTVHPVRCIGEIGAGDRFDLVLVTVRAEQLPATLPALTAMNDGSDVVFFGNIGGHRAELADALGDRAMFGFPAAGGTLDGPVVTYVLISQQTTMLGEPDGTRTSRTRRLRDVLRGAGFPTAVSGDIGGWLLGHSAFIVPIAFALYRVAVAPARLATDRATMRLMVMATQEAFTALRQGGNSEIPTNLRILYSLPTVLVAAYWRRIFAGRRGELWFAGHSRAAPDEMRSLGRGLQAVLRHIASPTPHLDELLDLDTEWPSG